MAGMVPIPMYYEFAVDFFVGLAAGIFWIGMERDAPKPGEPSWWRLTAGLLGGVAAVIFDVVTNVEVPLTVTIPVSAAVGACASIVAARLLERRGPTM